ncbi:MAG: CRISPR-associated helicase Cas3' [Gemmatimonadota bacterium]
MIEPMNYRMLVAAAAGFEPMNWQSRLACGAHANSAKPETLQKGEECKSRLIDIPTGCGKTAGAVLAWLWNRVVLETPGWPRRLVYCLPMRTLVEQTQENIQFWLLRIGLAATKGNTPERVKVNELIARLSAESAKKFHASIENDGSLASFEGSLSDHLASSAVSALIWLAEHSPVILMGGEELDERRREWDLHPEKPAVLIGTQDMLVSRALNRGYGMSRYRWPMHFGLLNTDCLWVFDEVQLMSGSLTTSQQLQTWRQQVNHCVAPLGTANQQAATLLPSHSWWMSATAAEHWFMKSIAMRDQVAALWRGRVAVHSPDEAQALFMMPKTLQRCPITLTATQDEYVEALAGHLADAQNRKGKKRAIDAEESEDVLTLVICNTVERATAVYQALAKLEKNASQERLFDENHLLLLHSRFRGNERTAWREKLKAFENGEGRNSGPRIIVATQVIEAGVDISAAVLYTELCPLASLIQRLGRCARRSGQSGKAFWIDFDAFETDAQEFSKEQITSARPYGPEEIGAARKALRDAEIRVSAIAIRGNTVSPEPARG